MKRFLAVLCVSALLAPVLSHADDEGPLSFKADIGNAASVQRGARDFMNYCSGCHSLKYLRYERFAADYDIPKDVVKQDLVFLSGEKVSSEMVNAMSAGDAGTWFGKAPPDLTLEAEVRSPRWIYNYLQSFYLDPTRPTGVNNPLLPGAAMPDVLWALQGFQQQVKDKDGETHLESVSQGSMSEAEFRGFAADVTNFLTYASAPDALHREALAPKVLLYLLVLLVLVYLLKKEFWRDVH